MTLNGFPTVLRQETVWLDSHRYQDAERQYHEYCARSANTAPSVKSEVKVHHSSHSEESYKNAKQRVLLQQHQKLLLEQQKREQLAMQSLDNGSSTFISENVNELLNNTLAPSVSLLGKPVSSLVSDIVNAREKIKNILSGDVKETNNSEILQRLEKLADENREMRKTVSEMSSKIKALEEIMRELTLSKGGVKATKQESFKSLDTAKQTSPSKKVANDDDDDDDVDLFGSDEENEEDARVREERLKAYENKKSKKPALVAKSSVVLDVKPWDDETDMKALEEAVRAISADGLKWGAGKLVPLAYGIKKLQLVAIVEDDKVSIDWLQEAIQENEDLVQSVDIAAFNKL